MILNELLNSDVPYRVRMQTRQQFMTVARIGDRDIKFNAEYGVISGSWQISYYETMNGRDTYSITNHGGEFQVFSMVVASMKQFVSTYDPERMIFTADEDAGPSRARLYEKLVQRYNRSGYDVDVSKGIGMRVFKLTKKASEVNPEKINQDIG